MGKKSIVAGTPNLYDRLIEIGALDKVINIGCAQAGVPLTYREDAKQECLIQFCLKTDIDGMENGQIVNLAKKIASRTGQNVRRNMSQATVIPQDVFQAYDPGARQQQIDITEDLTNKAMAIEGIMSLDEHDISEYEVENKAREIISQLDDDSRSRIDSALKLLPRSQIQIVYRVLFLNESVEFACERMGISPESGDRYVQRIENALRGNL